MLEEYTMREDGFLYDKYVEISKTKYLKKDNVKTSGLWVTLDEDENLDKQSAVVQMLIKYNCKNIKEILGRIVDTCLDDEGYLAIKSY